MLSLTRGSIRKRQTFSSTWTVFTLGRNTFVHSALQCSPLQRAFLSMKRDYTEKRPSSAITVIWRSRKTVTKTFIYEQCAHKKRDKICPHCGEAFFKRAAFDVHVARHTDDRKCAFDECGKYLVMQKDLDNHTRMHTLPLKCDVCEKGFTTNSKLRDHIRKVHEKKRSELQIRMWV